MSAADNKAVFLSYASQDAEAARRICEALRQAGVEVWFDQSELRGGDSWDQKIRKQIKECALFVPVVSASTQARREGYFRLEWRLAVERMRHMDDDLPFLLPVVIDETKDADAFVPEKFREVQWTRLQQGFGGQAPEEATLRAFCARVKTLLGGSASLQPALAASEGGLNHRATPVVGRRVPAAAWIGLAAAVVLGIVGFITLRPSPNAGAGTRPPTAAAPARPDAADRIARVRSILAQTDVVRAQLDVAGDLIDQAIKQDGTSAEAWAVRALVDWRYAEEQLDHSPARLDAARQHARQAVSLDEKNGTARLAHALAMVLLNNNASAREAAVKMLEPLALRSDVDVQVLLALGRLERSNLEKAFVYLNRAAQVPGAAGQAHFVRAMVYFRDRQIQRAAEAVDQALAVERATKFLFWKSYLQLMWEGDAGAAKRTIGELPLDLLVEDFALSARYTVELLDRDYEGALATLRAFPRDFLFSGDSGGPIGYYKGFVLALQGKNAAAEIEWRAALDAVERRLRAEPNDRGLLLSKVFLLASLGDKPAAEKIWRARRELFGESAVSWGDHHIRLMLLSDDDALDYLEAEIDRPRPGTLVLAGNLRLDPYLDRLRSHPRFAALLARAEADSRLSPRAAKASSERSSVDDAKSVAVLPFANLSDDKDQEYFSDGLTEEVLNALARERDLRVPGRSSSFSFKGKNVPAAEIARALNVTRLVEGSVRKSGNKVRISVSLTRASDGFSEELGTFTEELTDIFALQDKVARVVVEKLTRRSSAATVAVLTKNPEAYDAYLRGRALQTRAAVFRHQAAEHYERAVAADPQFALAWARLAEARFRDYRAFFDWRPAIVEATRTAIDRALVAQPDLPEALIVRAEWHRLVTCDYAAAQRDLDRAEALQPATSELRHAQGLLALDRGDEVLAKQHLRAAMQMDPENGDRANSIGNMFNTLGELATADDLYARAMRIQGPEQLIPVLNRVNLRARWRGPEAALRLLDRAPAGQRGIDQLAADLLLQLGRDAAVAERARRISIDQFSPGDFQIFQDAEGVANLLMVAGDTERARVLWQRLRDAASKEIAAGDLAPRVRKTLVRAEAALGHRESAQAALEAWRTSAAAIPSANRRLEEFKRLAVDCYADLGMKDEAMALLREIENSTFCYGFSLRGRPSFRLLHGDPRFEELVRRAEATAKAQPDPVEP